MPWNDGIVDSKILAVHAALVPFGEEGEVMLLTVMKKIQNCLLTDKPILVERERRNEYA